MTSLLPTSAIAASVCCTFAALAEETAVDVELVLAVDVSVSMSREELRIQRDGYASALTDPRVLDAIERGVHGRIAVTYLEWAGAGTQRVIMPWTLIASAADARLAARSLTAEPPEFARRTSISAAIGFAAELFRDNGYRGVKRIIDVSGDGPNNQGPPVLEARDRVIAEGIVINGLPLMTNSKVLTATSIPDLDDYYRNCVVGGAGSFMMPVNGWPQFAEAVRRKLELELAGVADQPVLRASMRGPYDCMVGERMWNTPSVPYEQD